MKQILITTCGLLLTALSFGQQLESYISEAESNNPLISSLELRYEASIEKVTEVNTVPDTQLGVGYFVSEPETRTGAQKFKASVKQMLPWFGTITARENYANSIAEADYLDIAIAKRKLRLSVSESYYKLYAFKAKEQVLEENIDLLETYEQLALTSVEVGKASAVDVLRLQIRQNELEQRKQVLVEAFKAEQILFNNLLNRNDSIPVIVAESLDLPAREVSYADKVLELNPELLKYDKLYESVAQSELLNQKESAPSIGFGLDYIAVEERPNMSFADNGKDILMPMVSLNIPIFNKKYSSRTRQNELQQRGLLAQKEEKLNTLQNLLAKAESLQNSAVVEFNIQSNNLQQARDAENILIKSYETGTIDFNDVLDIQELQLKFQLNQIVSTQKYYVQSAIINYLIN